MEKKTTEWYQVLIVEDNLAWSREMKYELAAILQISVDQVHVAADIEEAKLKLSTNFYHFVSLDMNLPTHHGGTVEVAIGAEFISHLALRNKFPCLGLAIYTAYVKDMNSALSIGRVAGHDAPIWLKSSGSGDLTGISEEQWAKNIKDWLEQKYLAFSFNQAANHFPCHLAETAGFISSLISNKDKKSDAANFMQQAIHFWSLTLRLATVQAMSFARLAKIHFNVPKDNTNESLEKTLSEILSTLNVKNSETIALWAPYLGISSTNDNAYFHIPFIDSSQKIRSLRNKLSHQTPLVDYREKVEKLIPDLKVIMDVAIFWANFPLLTEIESSGHNRYKAQLIKGSGYPWTEQEFKISMGEDSAEPNPDHIYLRYSSPYSEAVELIDLWPFVKKESISGMNRPCLYLFSHRWKNNWYRMSMMDGKAEVWHPSDEEAQILK